MAAEELDALLGHKLRQRVRGGSQVEQAPVPGLRQPSLIISVAVKKDALMVPEHLPEKVHERGVKVLRSLQPFGELIQRLRHDGVQDQIGPRDRV